MGDENKDLETPLWMPQASTPTPAAKTTPASAVASAPVAGVPPGLAARYDVLAQVGQGGMGVVYRARDRETEETVALKVLKAEIAARPDHIERFKSELRLARKITHKNVCRTHELLRFDDTVVIAMEFVEGESLRAVLKRFGGVPLRRGIEWLRQMCSALGEAHAQGIVHRDLKPENLIVDREGQIRIMDFGIAHSLETDKLEAGAVVGTPAYMSPEQAEGKPLDGRSDIYALGLIGYEMFTGRQAFGAATGVTQLRKRLVELPPAPRSVEPYLPAFLERVILRCLERDPQKRYASAGELEEALAKHEDEAEEERTPLPARLKQGSRVDLAWFAAGGAGLAAFIATASFLSPESLVRMRFTRPMLVEKARGELVARGWTPPVAPAFSTAADPNPYELLARRLGNETARRRFAEFPHVLLQVRFPKAENPREMAATVTYEPDGALRSVELPVVGYVPAGSAGLSREAALELADQELRKVFGVQAAAVKLEQEGTLTEGTRRGYSFRFTEADASGIQRLYLVNLFDRVTQVRKDHKLPEDYQRRRSSPFGPVLFSAWFAGVLLVFFLRRLFSRIQRREAICLGLVGAVGTAVTVNPTPGSEVVVSYLLATLLLATLAIVASSTACFVAQRPWPHVAAGYLALVRMRPRAPETGIAVARGAALGLAILGGVASLVRLGVAYDIVWPLPSTRSPSLASPFPAFTFLGELLLYSLFLMLFLAVVLSFCHRLTARPALLTILGGACWALFTIGSVPLDGFNVLVQFLMAAAFSAVLIHLDMLTLLAAILSYSLWGNGYPLLQMFELVGNSWVFLFLGAWTLGVVAAIYSGFRPLLQRAGQQAAKLVS